MRRAMSLTSGRAALEGLRTEEHILRMSTIGGRFTATQLVDAGLIHDVYLTTTSLKAGDPGTPWYCGDKLTAAHSVGSRDPWIFAECEERPLLTRCGCSLERTAWPSAGRSWHKTGEPGPIDSRLDHGGRVHPEAMNQ
jgi:hypothetical protein